MKYKITISFDTGEYSWATFDVVVDHVPDSEDAPTVEITKIKDADE